MSSSDESFSIDPLPQNYISTATSSKINQANSMRNLINGLVIQQNYTQTSQTTTQYPEIFPAQHNKRKNPVPGQMMVRICSI